MKSHKLIGSILLVFFLVSCASTTPKVQFDSFRNVKAPYIIDVIGDNRGNEKDYTKLISMIGQDNPVAVFNVGDLTEAPCIDTNEFKKESSVIKVPYLFAPGNHDIGIDAGACYLKWSGQPGLYYNFSIDKLSVIVLNSENLDAAQMQWLKNALARDNNKKLVFIHRPLYGNKVHPHLADSVRKPLHELFKANNVAVVFQGHDHIYNQETVDGISYIVTGGGGAPLYTLDGFYHYVRVTVRDTLYIEVIDIDGNVRFTYNIQ